MFILDLNAKRRKARGVHCRPLRLAWETPRDFTKFEYEYYSDLAFGYTKQSRNGMRHAQQHFQPTNKRPES